MLATITKAQMGTSYITALKNNTADVVTDTKDVISVMYCISSITPYILFQRDCLDALLQLEELQLAVAYLSNNK